MLVQNDHFGWRFFGQKYTRWPESLAITPKASADTVRVFVLGESAAYGDPQPGFGLPRMLDAMLSLRYPSTRFEVVNVAMTAINSHVIRAIARDCRKADGDIWVLYMGNNEVVGPFGGGTVFGPQAPPMAVIRANLALKSTRTGQLFSSLLAQLHPSKIEGDTWGGMKMFLHQQVSADDPRMNRVYAHFQHNLEDIIDCARRSDAGLVVCNVAVNLKDCAPFASQAPVPQDKQAAATWIRSYERGFDLQQKKKWAAALSAYEDAESIDDSVAELHFCKGRCDLALGRMEDALLEFRRARDLDTLRFRFDSRMQEIVSSVMEREKGPHVRFTDAEAAFISASTNRVPGQEFFYEHVHLTWEGNWLLAKTIAEQIQEMLPAQVKRGAGAMAAWPSAEQCALRLAWCDRTRKDGLNETRARIQSAPFTFQLNHQEQVAYLQSQIDRIQLAQGPGDVRSERALVESAAASDPGNSYLLTRLVNLRFQAGDTNGALASARQLTELYPYSMEAWDQLAGLYARLDRLGDALESYRRGIRLDPSFIWVRHHLAQACMKADMPEEALEQWSRVIRLQPMFGAAHLGMGQALEARGDVEAADKHYRKALQGQFYDSAGLVSLGQICSGKGWYEEALQGLLRAAVLAPSSAAIRYDLADVLKKLGRDEESAAQLAEAYRYDPMAWKSRFESGLELARQGAMQKAEKEFREVVRLKPDLIEGHLNLGGALLELGLQNEAALEFDQALRLGPTNPKVLEYLESLGFLPDNAGVQSTTNTNSALQEL